LSVIAIQKTNAQDADTTRTRTVRILNADRVTGSVEAGERVRRLVGDVRLLQDTTRLSADRATQFLDRQVTVFEGRVQITEGGDTLRARRVRYDQRAKRGIATGAVSVSDSAIVLRAPTATYDADRRLSTFDEGAVITERRPVGAAPDAAVATLTSRQGTYDSRRKLATFQSAVRLVDSTTVLTSERGTYGTRDRRADFAGDVRLVQPDTRMVADSIVHFRDEERSLAFGRVRIDRQERADSLATDSLRAERAVLFGDEGFHDEPARYSRMTGRPLLVLLQPDSTAEATADTLLVRARVLEAFRFEPGALPPDIEPPDSTAGPVAADSLTAVEGEERGEGERREEAEAPVVEEVSEQEQPDQEETQQEQPDQQPGPPALADSLAAAPPDSLAALPDTTRAPRAPVLQSLGPLIPRPGDRLLRVLATDSVRVVQRRLTAVADSAVLDRAEPPDADTLAVSREQLRLFGKPDGFAGRPRAWSDRLQLTADQVAIEGADGDLDRLRALGDAFAAQEDSALGRVQQIQGPQFEGRLADGELNRLLVWPNAEAIHFRADTSGALAGATQLSADSIAFVIAADTLRAVRAFRGIEGTYYEADLVPATLRLSSYSLAPDLEPSRAALLPDSLAALLDVPIEPAPPVTVLVESLDSLRVTEKEEEGGEEREEEEAEVPLDAPEPSPSVGPPALVGEEPVDVEAGGFGWLVTRSDPWAQAAWADADGYRVALLPAASGGWDRPQVVLGQFETLEAALSARSFLPPDVPAAARVVRLAPDGNARPEPE
jgi:lipopolysaccharide export system protein LptA